MAATEQQALAKRDLAGALAQARQATLQLVTPLSDEALAAQVSPLMSPLVWDLAHIGWFEDLWLARRVGRQPAADGLFDDLYDAFRHRRSERAELPILTPGAARAYIEDVRERSLAVLDGVALDEHEPLLRDGFVVGLVVQHELQHQETMLQTLQLAREAYPTPARDDLGPAPATEELLVPAGPFALGDSRDPWAYDNERPAHEVELPAFAIERYPVTNARYLEFVEDAGYRRRALWSDDGWAWLQQERAEAPLFWERGSRERGSDGWRRRRFGRLEPLPPAEPVQHISFYEAEAVAAWAGKRLPSEAEWERAAQGADAHDGAANLGRAAFGPLPVGERGASSLGCACMLGDVWEWTRSTFAGYPGFRAFPYREYSEVFFGDEYRVLRGGSWATDPRVARVTFRNWDYPQRRQIFSGVRLVREA